MSGDLHSNFALKDCLFEAVKLTRNADSDKYFHSEYDVRFDWQSLFLILNFGFRENIIFGIDNNSTRHTDNRKKGHFSFWRRTSSMIRQYCNKIPLTLLHQNFFFH